ncbi:MAG: DUF2130 domain-containing protein [Arenicella sp.]
MSNLSIECPHCQNEIEIAEQLAAPLVEAEREKIAEQAVSQALAKQQQEMQRDKALLVEQRKRMEQSERREMEALKAKESAEEAKRQVELTVKRKVEAERDQIALKASADAKQEMAAKLHLLEQEKADQAAKLIRAQDAEVKALQVKAQAEQEKREVALTVARKLEEQKEVVRQQALSESDNANRLKVAEKDQQLDEMRRQIDELKRKGEQGSQQTQGDVQEVDLMQSLQQAFPVDSFQRIGTGQRGADILQTVFSANGVKCGSILWESKRTATFSKPWLPKLREDQRCQRADIAALVTQAIPDGLNQFDLIEGVWVSNQQSYIPMALSLRVGIIEAGNARLAVVGANSKKDAIYQYLTGQEFRQRVHGVVDCYIQMRNGLDTEKRSYTRIWSQREKQLESLINNMSGMYGDLQGIAGANLPEVEGLVLGGVLSEQSTAATAVNQAAELSDGSQQNRVAQ